MTLRSCLTLGLIFIAGAGFSAGELIELRDPTKPIVEENTKETPHAEDTFKLQSIIISPTRRIAMINDTLVQIGDTIGSARVEMIEKNSVTLSKSGTITTIYLIDKRGWAEKKWK